jgi:uncharacterized membrane protein YfcA
MTALAVAVAVIAVTSAVHGAVGFGMNLLAVPVLVVLDPTFVPGPAVAAGLVLSVLVAGREREPLDRRLGWAFLGLVPGTLLALWLLALVPAESLAAPMGVLVLVAVVVSAIRVRLSPTRRTLAVAGVASGFLATAGSIGGPPMALVYAQSHGPRLRSSLSVFFVVTAVASLVALAAAGHFGVHELRVSALFVPGVLVGFLASGPLRPLVDRGHVRPAVLWLSGLAGVGAIVEGLLH